MERTRPIVADKKSPLGPGLLYLALPVFAIKILFLLLDPSPEFFLGDSGSYLHSALTGWIPPDRSYLYGYFIRWVSVSSGSLFSLVLAQALASAGSAILVGWILIRFIGVSRRITLAAVMLYCLEPLQLMYERFVMAEAFSLLAILCSVGLLLLFLENGRNRYLVLASFAGIIAVALRISYLPVVFALSVAAPVLRYLFIRKRLPVTPRPVKAFAISIVVMALSYIAFHTSYKLLTGRLAGRPPAYQYADGLALIASWCPAMTSQDLKAVGVPEEALAGIYPTTFDSRRAQRWMSGGIVAALNRNYPDPLTANAIAKKLSLQILRRDPLGVAALGMRTYLNGWRRDVIKVYITEDAGARAIPTDLVKRSARYFHIAAQDMAKQKTLTKAWFRQCTDWYRVLLLVPWLLLITSFLCDARRRPYILLITGYAIVVVLTMTGLAVDNSIRYLHPMGWVFLIVAAYWTNTMMQRISLLQNGLLRRVSLAALGCYLVALAPTSVTGQTYPPGLYVRNGVLMRQGQPYHGIGANYNTLFGQLLQDGNNHSSLDNLAHLAKAGIPFVRFRACGFGPENYQLYLHDRPEYFRRMDLVVHCAEENHIGLIPSLFWRLATVPQVVGESRDQLGNPNSKANQFIRQYTQEMVSRYNKSPAIWAWEFGNEANLGVDLGNGGRRGQLFGNQGNQLRSGELRAVLVSFAQTVRAIDPYRAIEAGTCLPRPSAWHMAHGQSGRDDEEQALSSLLSLTPDPMNVISIHAYERAKENYPGAHSIADVLRAVTRSAAAAGKPVFVGEFPVRNPAQTEEFLQAIEMAHVPLSAFWVFDLPQQQGINVSFTNERASVLDTVAKANRALQER